MKIIKIKGIYNDEHVVADLCNLAKKLYDKGRFGEIKKDKIKYSLLEALFLLDTGKLDIIVSAKKIFDFDSFLKKIKKSELNFWSKYCVYKDLRIRGYIVKTALKFGADFRVYDRGIKPGKGHATWIVYPVYESDVLTWYDFAAKNRVAHSTKKKLLLGIVDNEEDVTYYEVGWIKP